MYRIYHNVEGPTPQRTRRLKWDVPLDEIEPGSKMVLEMTPNEAREKIHAFRSFIDRQQRKLNRKFSVILTDAGIEVFSRIPEKVPATEEPTGFASHPDNVAEEGDKHEW